MSGNRNYITPFNYFGSKFGQLKWLKGLIPPPIPGVNTHLAEVMCGSAVLTINTDPFPINTINDINGQVTNFFRVLRNQPDELIRLLNLTPHSHEEYDNSWIDGEDSEIEQARKYFIRVRQSFGGMGAQKQNKGWSMATKVTRCRISEATNKWLKGIDGLFEIVNRLKTVQIENRDFRKLMPLLNQKTTVVYLDPPYDDEKSPGSRHYKHSFHEGDHRELSDLAHSTYG